VSVAQLIKGEYNVTELQHLLAGMTDIATQA
jgi:hypothetical protein